MRERGPLKITRQAAADAARDYMRHPSYPILQGWLLNERTRITEEGKKSGKGEIWYRLDGFDTAITAVERLASIAPKREADAGDNAPGMED